jgi:hypothetical protein
MARGAVLWVNFARLIRAELFGNRHGVSANASQTKPARLLAVFVVDTNETELTIPHSGLRFYLLEEEANALWREPTVKLQ